MDARAAVEDGHAEAEERAAVAAAQAAAAQADAEAATARALAAEKKTATEVARASELEAAVLCAPMLRVCCVNKCLCCFGCHDDIDDAMRWVSRIKCMQALGLASAPTARMVPLAWGRLGQRQSR